VVFEHVFDYDGRMTTSTIVAEPALHRAVLELVAALDRLSHTLAERTGDLSFDESELVALLGLTDSVGPEVDWELSRRLDRVTHELGGALERRGISPERARAEYVAGQRHQEAARREQVGQWRRMAEERRARRRMLVERRR
jgi:hypothetical protein